MIGKNQKRPLARLGAMILSLALVFAVAPMTARADESDDDGFGSWDWDGGHDYDDTDNDNLDDDDDRPILGPGGTYQEEGQHVPWGEIHGPSDIHLQEDQSLGVDIDVDIEANRNWYTEWSISNTGIASLTYAGDSHANIYASNPDSTTCTVQLYDRLTGGLVDTYRFNIYVDRAQPKYVPVNGVSMDTGSMSMTIGDHGQLNARVYPSNATNKDIDWYTSNDSVVEIHGDGVIYAKGEGTATITARSVDSGDTATCKIHVQRETPSYVPVDVMGIYPQSIAVGIGQSTRIQFQVYPVNATNKGVRIYSDNNAIATVTQDGVVTGQRKGACHIVFTSVDGGKTALATVSVAGAPAPSPTPTPAPTPAPQGANGHDANVQFGYLTQIAKTPAGGTCLLNSPYPSAYDVNVINGIKSRSDATIIAQFPFQGHTFQMIVPKTFDMTKYAVGGYVDWLTLCNYQTQGVVVKIIK